jgi:hypothetical protein
MTPDTIMSPLMLSETWSGTPCLRCGGQACEWQCGAIFCQGLVEAKYGVPAAKRLRFLLERRRSHSLAEAQACLDAIIREADRP